MKASPQKLEKDIDKKSIVMIEKGKKEENVNCTDIENNTK